ncbi:MAG: aminotransferase class I/II-fold pyridoxal phosphate-dependent enzyme, partial [Cytophagales bacterium]|nr:aminotransferase class I/II-fold pyridoxal phosphate-dependent enzyme [Cytophagales bacterium]
GWIAADSVIIEKLAKMKQASDLHSNLISQYILHQYLIDNNLNEHISTIKSHYGKQKDLMVDLVQRNFPPSISFVNPTGGMFLWIRLPSNINSYDVLEKALKSKVIFVPGDNFYVCKGEKNTLRLNFSNSNPSQMEKGIKILGEILWEMGC